MNSDDVAPYHALAANYDELLGEQSFQKMRDSFEWLVDRYGLQFRSAADVGCGTGTFVEYLLRSGADPVWGVDISPEMLAQAVAKNGDNGARFLLQDLRELLLPETVDLVVCQFETLNYVLTDSDLHMAFEGFTRALTVGGHAVFDVAARRPSQPGSRFERSWFGNQSVTIRARYDTERLMQVAHVRIADPGAATRSETHVQRIHTIDDVTAALEGTGLVLRAMHDGADLARPAEGADDVIFLAQRTS